MSDWQNTPLEKVVTLQRGIDLPRRSRKLGPYAVLGSNGPVGYHNHAPVKGPGVVIGRATNLGRPTYWREDFWPLNTCLFVKDFLGNEPRFVYYLFESMDLSGFDSGSVQPMLNRNYIAKVPVSLPSPTEQRAIASVLGALDDKIETNRRLIRTLDELYMAECASALCISSEDVSLGKVASLSLGGTPSKENSSFWEGGNIPWINSGRLHEFPVLTPSDFITPEGLSKSATKLIPKGSTVVAITGATLGVVSRLAIDTAINQSIVAVECRGNIALNSFMLYALRANMAELVSSATGAAQQHVNKANFEELVISIPVAEGERLLPNIPNLLEQIDALANENVTLSLLRDTLLPELLSGRLRVKDAESMMENV